MNCMTINIESFFLEKYSKLHTDQIVSVLIKSQDTVLIE